MLILPENPENTCCVPIANRLCHIRHRPCLWFFRIAIILAASSGKSVVYPQQGIENIMNKVTKPIENISFFAII